MTTLLEAAQALVKSVRDAYPAQFFTPIYEIHAPKLHALEQAIAQEQASQTASANPVVSQDVVETVDKDCDTCNNRHKRMHQEPCFSCHGYTNWEPKP